MLSGTISYIYTATGIKLKKIVSTGTTTSYAGNYVYENDALQFFNQPEGYVEPVSTGSTNFAYVYQYKDHLGNVRLSYSDSNGDGVITPTGLGAEIREENNYYPFGLKHKGYNANIISEDKYHTFQGQEEEKELGKNTYAYQWRDYDPAIGRFNKIDRFAEKYYDLSTYSFTANNPIVFREVQGDSINVAAQYQEQFTKVLESTFGDNASKFSFDDNGNLSFNGTKKDFKGKDNKVFKDLNKLIGSETTTDVVFEEKITLGGKEINVDGEGGALTLLASENPSMQNNLIAINPNAPTRSDVGVGIGMKDGKLQTLTKSVISSTATNVFHEFGHVLFDGQDQTQVIIFDNLVRGIQRTRQPDGTFKSTPIAPRPAVDLTHSSATITIQY